MGAPQLLVPDQNAGYPRWDVDMESGDIVVVDQYTVPWGQIMSYAQSLFPQIALTTTNILVVIGAPWGINPAYRCLRYTITPIFDEQTRITSQTSPFGFGLSNNYQAATFTVTYGVPNFGSDSQQDDDPVPYLKHDVSTGAAYQTLPSTGWEWQIDGVAFQDHTNSGFMETHKSHQIAWPRVLNPPFSVIDSASGKVNSGTWTWRTGTVPAEALLFLGADINEEVLPDGTLTYRMVYHFEEIVGRIDEQTGGAAGWNHYYRDDDTYNGWFRVVRSSGKRISGPISPYETTNFNPLFGL